MLKKYYSFLPESQECDKLRESHGPMQACIDEAGRGSWAGRVYTAAVIWNYELDDNYTRMIKDSKKLSPTMRSILAEYIADNAIDYAISFMEPSEIDEMNILNATLACMHMSLDSLKVNFDSIIVDGNQFNKYKDIPHKCIVNGDNKYLGIACASILAKVEHDRHMRELDIEYPEYDWKKNMGYGSLSHKIALDKYGICKYHRLTYNPMKTMILNGQQVPAAESAAS